MKEAPGRDYRPRIKINNSLLWLEVGEGAEPLRNVFEKLHWSGKSRRKLKRTAAVKGKKIRCG